MLHVTLNLYYLLYDAFIKIVEPYLHVCLR